jgi:hypothetical protein
MTIAKTYLGTAVEDGVATACAAFASSGGIVAAASSLASAPAIVAARSAALSERSAA